MVRPGMAYHDHQRMSIELTGKLYLKNDER